ncbi:MAG: transposase [Chloroflexota bacterium]
MAKPSLIGLIDSFGIELIHPRREGRSDQQIGRKGLSNRRWIVGGKLCVLLNHLGLVVDWDGDTANVYDGSAFQEMVDKVADEMLVFGDPHFVKKDWHPTNLKPCKRGEWNSRMLVETFLSMLTVICHFKHLTHRVWAYFEMRLAYTMTMFNILVQWHGLQPDNDGFVRLSIAEFSL